MRDKFYHAPTQTHTPSLVPGGLFVILDDAASRARWDNSPKWKPSSFFNVVAFFYFMLPNTIATMRQKSHFQPHRRGPRVKNPFPLPQKREGKKSGTRNGKSPIKFTAAATEATNKNNGFIETKIGTYRVATSPLWKDLSSRTFLAFWGRVGARGIILGSLFGPEIGFPCSPPNALLWRGVCRCNLRGLFLFVSFLFCFVFCYGMLHDRDHYRGGWRGGGEKEGNLIPVNRKP